VQMTQMLCNADLHRFFKLFWFYYDLYGITEAFGKTVNYEI
jgi:hypothetical protein